MVNIFCLYAPGIIIGIYFLKVFENLINFNYLVSFIIFTVLFLSFLHQEKNFIFTKNIKKTIIALTGVVHGITNSGGSLLSLLIISNSVKNLHYLRYQIIFFYLSLVVFQYSLLMLIYGKFFLVSFNYIFFLPLIAGFVGKLSFKTN